MNRYIINSNTLYLRHYFNDNTTFISEKREETATCGKPMKIIKNSCGYYGYSYNSQRDYIVNKFNYIKKTPVIISNFNNILFFPTLSPESDKCIWISYNNIDRYVEENDKTKIYFKGGKILLLNMSFRIFDNQITRCIKIEKYLTSMAMENFEY